MARPSVVVAGSTWVWVAIPPIRVGGIVGTLHVFMYICIHWSLCSFYKTSLYLTPLLVPEFVVDFPPPGIFKVGWFILAIDSVLCIYCKQSNFVLNMIWVWEGFYTWSLIALAEESSWEAPCPKELRGVGGSGTTISSTRPTKNI